MPIISNKPKNPWLYFLGGVLAVIVVYWVYKYGFAKSSTTNTVQSAPRRPESQQRPLTVGAAANNTQQSGVDPQNAVIKHELARYPTVEQQNEQRVTQNKNEILSVDHLMPANYQDSNKYNIDSSNSNTTDDAWSKYAPTKAGFDKVINSAGWARLGQSSRSVSGPLARNIGSGLVIDPRGKPAIPTSGKSFEWNDSSSRLDLIQDKTGIAVH